MVYDLYYDSRLLISLDIGDSCPEEWADLYAAESGLDREYDYDPSLLYAELAETD